MTTLAAALTQKRGRSLARGAHRTDVEKEGEERGEEEGGVLRGSASDGVQGDGPRVRGVCRAGSQPGKRVMRPCPACAWRYTPPSNGAVSGSIESAVGGQQTGVAGVQRLGASRRGREREGDGRGVADHAVTCQHQTKGVVQTTHRQFVIGLQPGPQDILAAVYTRAAAATPSRHLRAAPHHHKP